MLVTNTTIVTTDPEQLGQGEIISIASGGVVALIIAAVVAVVMIRKKKSNGGKEITKPKQGNHAYGITHIFPMNKIFRFIIFFT